MSRLPTMDRYQDAVQTPRVAFLDPELQVGQVETSGLGLPRAYSGGFAITYSVRTGSKRFAVRVFHRKADGLEARYSKISTALRSAASPYFVAFEYQPRGVKVDGVIYPIVKMEWVKGDTLATYVGDWYQDATKMRALREQFRQLAKAMEQSGFAHGDLQNGNVMVEHSGVRLIDYDGMFVPGMALGDGAEIGNKHFQHPARGPQHFGPAMDRFSSIVLDVSLAAIAEDHRRFPRYGNTGENLLFTANDFADPNGSEVFNELCRSPCVGDAARRLRLYCVESIDSIPTLEAFIGGASPSPKSRPATPVPRTVKNGYSGSLPVLDGLRFDVAAGLMGDRVELVGQVRLVTRAATRKGARPYGFLHFSPTRVGDIVKVNIWSTGLANMKIAIDQSLVGKWISVTGIVDPVYRSQRYNAYGVTVHEASQLHVITEGQARFRLASAITSIARSQNQQILDELRGGSVGASPSRSGAGRAAKAPVTSNAAILGGILGSQAGGKGGRVGASQPQTNAAGRRPPSMSSGVRARGVGGGQPPVQSGGGLPSTAPPVQATPAQTSESGNSCLGCVIPVVVLIVIAMIARSCG